MMELLCARDLAIKLGAVAPISPNHHRLMRDHGDLLIRVESGQALFWPLQKDLPVLVVRSS